MCAIQFSQPLLALLGNPERVHVIVLEPRDELPQAPGQPRWEMHIALNPRGYKMNFKPGSVQGEIAVAWNELKASPPDTSGKGRLPCKLLRGTLVVDISAWKGTAAAQDFLFPSWGKVLCP